MDKTRTRFNQRADKTREWLNRWAGAILVVFSLLVGGLYAYQVADQRAQAKEDRTASECQARYNKAFATQLTERSRLTAASDNAKNDLLGGISKLIFAPPTTDPKVEAKRAAEFRDLFTKFDKAVAKVDKDRAATPLPEIPNC